MKSLRRLAALLSLAALFLFTTADQVRAANIVVSGACTLPDAITAANTDAAVGGCPAGSAGVDVIELTANVTLVAADNVDNGATGGGANGLPIVTSEIVLLGNGFTIQRSSPDQFRFFEVENTGDLTLDDVTLSNGDVVGAGVNCAFTVSPISCGGALLNRGGDVTIRNGTRFLNNMAEGGGALWSNGGLVNITDATFSGNTATEFGGAILQRFSIMVIERSSFTGNQAALVGGAIFNQSELDIFDSQFTSNEVTTDAGLSSFGGGAISNQTFNGVVTIGTSSFTNNTAPRGGALLNDNAADLTVDNSLIDNNQATSASAAGGGGIWSINNAVLTLTNSRVTNNQSTNSIGGGIALGSQSSAVNDFTLINVEVSGNTANSSGGGIYIFISSSGGPGTISNSVISGNEAANIGRGGGIFSNGPGQVILNSSLISENTARLGGGGIHATCLGCLNPLTDPFQINDSTIADNEVTIFGGTGGGINVEDGGAVEVNRSTISDNTAPGTGGGIYTFATNSRAEVYNSTISGNQASNGGGVATSSADPFIIEYTTITENIALSQGGGIQTVSAMTITSSIIANNDAQNSVNPQAENCLQGGMSITNGGGNFTDNDANSTCPFTLDPNISLGPLADNGGPTLTHALLAGGPIDANGACGINDQRGAPRDATCDSGSFEAVAIIPPVVTFELADSSIEEIPGGPTSVEITLDNTLGNLTGGFVTVNVSITGTATNGVDYTSSTMLPVVFNAGTWPAPGSENTQTIDFSILPDFLVEGDETVVLTLLETSITGPAELGPITEHILTIEDGLADLEVTKTVTNSDDNGNGNVDIAETLTFEIEVTNNGPEDATDITINDVLNTVNLDVSSAVITESIGTYNPVTDEWSADGAGVGNGFAVDAGDTETLTIAVPVLAGTPRTFSNVARIYPAFPPQAADDNLSNNLASVSVRIGNNNRDDDDDDEEEEEVVAALAASDESLAVSADGSLIIDVEADPNVVSEAGDAVTWTVTVTNVSDTAFDPGELVTVIDALFALQSVTGTQGVSELVGNQILTQPGVLQPGVPLVLTIPSSYTGAAALTLPGRAAQTDPDDLCGTGTISGISDTACVSLLPDTLPATGGQPVRQIGLGAAIAAILLLLFGGYWLKRNQKVGA